jgi:hypothetical protein
MKMTNICPKGRFQNKNTGQTVNLYIGRQVSRSIDIIFYYYKFKRKVITDKLFHDDWILIGPIV